MYGAISDALASSVAASVNPLNGIVTKMAGSVVESQETEAVKAKATAIEEIEQKLVAAKDRQAPASVIGAYEKLLARLTK